MAHAVSRRLLFTSVGTAVGLALTGRARRVAAETALGTLPRCKPPGTVAGAGTSPESVTGPEAYVICPIFSGCSGDTSFSRRCTRPATAH